MTVAQKALPQSELGVATLGATFFGSTGGSFGVAIFGAIFSNVLAGNLARHLRGAQLPAGFTSRSITPALLARLPASIQHTIAAVYADSVHTVFLIAVPIGAVAFAATLFIPRIELRT